MGLMTLIDGGVFPYFIGSHTSAWHQPNDNGLNKAEYDKAVQLWRGNHPLMVFDLIAFNWCCARAIQEVRTHAFLICPKPHQQEVHVTQCISPTWSWFLYALEICIGEHAHTSPNVYRSPTYTKRGICSPMHIPKVVDMLPNAYPQCI